MIDPGWWRAPLVTPAWPPREQSWLCPWGQSDESQAPLGGSRDRRAWPGPAGEDQGQKEGSAPAPGTLAPERALGGTFIIGPQPAGTTAPLGKALALRGTDWGLQCPGGDQTQQDLIWAAQDLTVPGLEGEGRERCPGCKNMRGRDSHQRSWGLGAGQAQPGEGDNSPDSCAPPVTCMGSCWTEPSGSQRTQVPWLLPAPGQGARGRSAGPRGGRAEVAQAVCFL